MPAVAPLPPPPPDHAVEPAGSVPPAGAWLVLALGALSVSGVFAALLVLMRAPGLSTLLPAGRLFPAALALHVNLAFVVWFLAMASTFFTLHRRRRRPVLDGVAFALGAGGTLAMTFSAFLGGRALMNNYLPMLTNPLFGGGLAVFFTGVGLAAALTLAERPSPREPERFGAWLAAGTTLAAVGAIAASWVGLPADLGETARFEALFWAGGHVLQFTHTVLLLTTWLALGRASGILSSTPRWASALLAVAALPVLLAPLGFLHPVPSPEHRAFFTALMRWGTWPALPCSLAVLAWGWWRNRPHEPDTRPLRLVVGLSAAIFSVGLVFGAFIRHDGLLVTAHYHGAVGAVTLAYMGWARLLAGRLGLGRAARPVATLQSALYGGGLLGLVIGLASAGATGLPRKTPEALFPSQGAEQIGSLALLAAGGLVAVAGVALFLGSTFAALRRGAEGEPEPARPERAG